MTAGFKLDALDLAALLCSRVCHDVINPVGAIINGLEVLEEEDDASMKAFALDLIGKSARTASARLQFARLAFGAAGSAGASINLNDAENVAKNLLNDGKLSLSWTAPALLMPKNRAKLLLNLLIVAGSTIPRGGTLALHVTGDVETPHFEIVASGTHARIPAGLPDLLEGRPQAGHETLDSHVIQPYYTGLLAREAGMSISITSLGDGVRLTASS